MKSQKTTRRLTAFARSAALGAVLLGLLFGIAPLSACGSSKPSAKECKAAIENIRKLRNTSQIALGADPRKAVRSCQGNSSKKSVRCFIDATTEAELRECEGTTGAKAFEREKKLREEQNLKDKEREAEEAAKKKKEEAGE